MRQPSINELRVSAARASLTERLDALERKATGVASDTIDGIRDTATGIRDAVSGTATEVKEAIVGAATGAKHALDVPQHVRDHPWESVGLAAVAGFAAGVWPVARSHVQQMISSGGGSTPRYAASAPSSQRSGILDELFNIARRELVSVGEAAMAAGAAAIKENLAEVAHLGAGRNGRHNGQG